MKRVYITFGGRGFDIMTKEIVERAPKMGADEVRVYDDRWLMHTEFYEHNKWMWNLPGSRGFGWFCWKPYIIMHALENYCCAGDVVLYADADTYPIHDFSMLYEECANIGGCMLFAAQGQDDINWVKRDCWIVMNEEPTSREAAVARFMLFRKGPWRPRQLLMEWLTYCVNLRATTFDKSVLGPELPELHEHRTEQAILSLLAHKYGYKLYREACQYGVGAYKEGVDTFYPQLFVQEDRRTHAGLAGSIYANV